MKLMLFVAIGGWLGMTLAAEPEPLDEGDLVMPYYFQSAAQIQEFWSGEKADTEGSTQGEVNADTAAIAHSWSPDSLVLLSKIWNGVQDYSTLTDYSYARNRWFSQNRSEPLPWTHQAVDYEDASSTHYYFYRSNGETVERVRWVWNGGAQNPPEVIDFHINAGSVYVVKSLGQRKSLPELIQGLDVPLLLEYEGQVDEVVARDSPEAPALTDTQRFDLKVLIDLLAKDRSRISESDPLK